MPLKKKLCLQSNGDIALWVSHCYFPHKETEAWRYEDSCTLLHNARFRMRSESSILLLQPTFLEAWQQGQWHRVQGEKQTYFTFKWYCVLIWKRELVASYLVWLPFPLLIARGLGTWRTGLQIPSLKGAPANQLTATETVFLTHVE